MEGKIFPILLLLVYATASYFSFKKSKAAVKNIVLTAFLILGQVTSFMALAAAIVILIL